MLTGTLRVLLTQTEAVLGTGQLDCYGICLACESLPSMGEQLNVTLGGDHTHTSEQPLVAGLV